MRGSRVGFEKNSVDEGSTLKAHPHLSPDTTWHHSLPLSLSAVCECMCVALDSKQLCLMQEARTLRRWCLRCLHYCASVFISLPLLYKFFFFHLFDNTSFLMWCDSFSCSCYSTLLLHILTTSCRNSVSHIIKFSEFWYYTMTSLCWSGDAKSSTFFFFFSRAASSLAFLRWLFLFFFFAFFFLVRRLSRARKRRHHTFYLYIVLFLLFLFLDLLADNCVCACVPVWRFLLFLLLPLFASRLFFDQKRTSITVPPGRRAKVAHAKGEEAFGFQRGKPMHTVSPSSRCSFIQVCPPDGCMMF